MSFAQSSPTPTIMKVEMRTAKIVDTTVLQKKKTINNVLDERATFVNSKQIRTNKYQKEVLLLLLLLTIMLTNRSIKQENNKTKSQPNFAPKKKKKRKKEKNSIQNGDPSNPRIICRRFIHLCIALFLRTILFTFFRSVVFVRFCVLSPEAAISVCVGVWGCGGAGGGHTEDTHQRRRDAQRTDTLWTGWTQTCIMMYTQTQTQTHSYRVVIMMYTQTHIDTHSYRVIHQDVHTDTHIHIELYIKMYTHSHTYTDVHGGTKIIHILFSYRPHQERLSYREDRKRNGSRSRCREKTKIDSANHVSFYIFTFYFI